MRKIGSLGEELAVSALLAEGCEIVARNWRCRHGEIDLVVKDGPYLVFVEVKTRTTDKRGTAAEAVDVRKQKKLRLLARHFVFETGLTAPAYRFDVVAISGREKSVKIIKNAF
ncbi:MAG TPA: YraN family protein [Firmicutes bacterium]|nr:YraN family protein [Bacillota bacterium]